MPRSSPTRDDLGRVLRAFRKDAGLTQEGLAARSGLHRNYVGSVERGERNPAFEAIEKWLRGVGISWELFGQALDEAARTALRRREPRTSKGR